MCGIAGFFAPGAARPSDPTRVLQRMNELQRHRGPDGEGLWVEPRGRAGLAHVRLSIIDLSTGAQPMASPSGNVISYNGEVYNYLELRRELGEERFKTTSDTEVILAAYERWGPDCVTKLRGMFAFALWDAKQQKIFIGRDRFGIKPFYYSVTDGIFYFASESKVLLPYVSKVAIDPQGLHDYFCFQFCLGGKTMFAGIRQVEPAHAGYVNGRGEPELRRYWEVHYDLDWHHTERFFMEEIRARLDDSVSFHLRSDVEVGAYVSGGTDSSLLASLARDTRPEGSFQGFNGKFGFSEQFDESRYARALAKEKRLTLHEVDIGEQDFADNIAKVIYHLDQPNAGPGSFPQYLVSRLVRQKGVKVVLGGQGGDEIFGGYARYLIAYFEQCIKGAIDGTMHSGNFVVTYESIIPNLVTLQNYKPLLQEFWSEGIFEDRDKRYFRLVNRSNMFGDIIDWSMFQGAYSFEEFKRIFWGGNVGKESYFDSMTHFDFKTLLPALLQVEDRMSMAHGVESRVPFLDHPLVELAATVPANVKFQNGELKRLLRVAFADSLPRMIRERKDKMGFPVPLQLWLKRPGVVREFVLDTFRSTKAQARPYLRKGIDIERMVETEGLFGRNLWALLSLELWHQAFLDRKGSA
jgi:asparagine synthase (glutamine-hydrolysing)